MLSTAQFGRAMVARRANGMVVVRMIKEVAPSSLPKAMVSSATSQNIWNDNTAMHVVNGKQNLQSRYFSDQPPVQDDDKQDDKTGDNNVLYEGPFAKLSLRLKRVSVSTAAVSLVGIPLIVFLQNNAVPASGQIAVGGTALFAATGSTLALSYCFSPYVHTLERVHDPAVDDEDQDSSSHSLIKATTCNIIGMKVETVFDPKIDVSPSTGNRPFCNFEVKGRPMYIHPELMYNEELRTQLVGEVKSDNLEQQKAFDSKNKEDDFL